MTNTAMVTMITIVAAVLAQMYAAYLNRRDSNRQAEKIAASNRENITRLWDALQGIREEMADLRKHDALFRQQILVFEKYVLIVDEVKSRVTAIESKLAYKMDIK